MTDKWDELAREVVEARICCTAAQRCRVDAFADYVAAVLRERSQQVAMYGRGMS